MNDNEITQADRAWWPDFMLGESMPFGKPHPSDWLRQLNDGAQAYGDTEDQAEGGSGFERLIEGQLCGFSYRDELGTLQLTLDADGTHEWDGPIPAKTTHLWVAGDTDTLADNPKEFVEFLRDAGETEGTFEVQLDHWSPESNTFRFTALDGPPRFERVSLPLPDASA